jgi:CRISPR-associated protein Csb2
LTDGVREFAEVLSTAARSLVALGWGVDLVAGNGRVITAEEADGILGQRWRPTIVPTSDGLRVPIPGTLEALTTRHEAFLGRLCNGGLTPVPALSAFAVVGYRREFDPAVRPFAAFEIWKPVHELAELPAGKSKFRPFDPVRRTVAVAGMVRNATAELAAQMRPFEWGDGDINTFVHGHTPDGTDRLRGGPDLRRFAYLPLPSLERRVPAGGPRAAHVGSIRRLLVVGPPDGAAEVDWVRRALSGRELTDEDSQQPAAVLSVIPLKDANVLRYTEAWSTWSTVTPVVLPGYDDAQPHKTERLLRKAIEQAGFSKTLAQYAELDWRRIGFRAGLQPATRYEQPARLKGYPRYHVRLHWRDSSGRPIKVRGPVVIGAARYCGLGLFAGEAVIVDWATSTPRR